jgi:ABC-type multidrug transport system fused ATPase/permease subunit
LPLIPLLVIYYVYQLHYRTSARELKRLDSTTRSPIFAHFSETLSGLSTIRAYGEEKRFIENNERLLNTNAAPSYLNRQLPSWLSIRLEGLSSFFSFFTALLFVLQKDSVNPSIVGLSLSYIIQITGSLAWCARQFAETGKCDLHYVLSCAVSLTNF